jgi:hypothetical protein
MVFLPYIGYPQPIKKGIAKNFIFDTNNMIIFVCFLDNNIIITGRINFRKKYYGHRSIS